MNHFLTFPSSVSRDYSHRNSFIPLLFIVYSSGGNKFLELEHFMFLPYKQKISFKIYLYILKKCSNLKRICI